MKLIWGSVLAASAMAAGAWAQDLGQIKDDVQIKKMMLDLQKMAAEKAGAELVATGGIMRVVKNAPYSADQMTENTQVLGDGTRIHTENKVTVTRDSQGRVRRETPTHIEIWDPVENVTYGLDPKRMTVTQMRVFSQSIQSGPNTTKRFAFSGDSAYITTDQMKAAAAADKAAAAGAVTVSGGEFGPDAMGPVTRMVIVNGDGLPPREIAAVKMAAAGGDAAIGDVAVQAKAATRANRETLGSQRMEGLSADGTRDTTVIEAGAIGNDRPINIVNERWYSQELQTEVMTRHNDPRMGEQVTRLTNVRLGEPDPSLFQVPAGYQKMPMPPMPPFRKDQ